MGNKLTSLLSQWISDLHIILLPYKFVNKSILSLCTLLRKISIIFTKILISHYSQPKFDTFEFVDLSQQLNLWHETLEICQSSSFGRLTFTSDHRKKNIPNLIYPKYCERWLRHNIYDLCIVLEWFIRDRGLLRFMIKHRRKCRSFLRC